MVSGHPASETNVLLCVISAQLQQRTGGDLSEQDQNELANPAMSEEEEIYPSNNQRAGSLGGAKEWWCDKVPAAASPCSSLDLSHSSSNGADIDSDLALSDTSDGDSDSDNNDTKRWTQTSDQLKMPRWPSKCSCQGDNQFGTMNGNDEHEDSSSSSSSLGFSSEQNKSDDTSLSEVSLSTTSQQGGADSAGETDRGDEETDSKAAVLILEEEKEEEDTEEERHFVEEQGELSELSLVSSSLSEAESRTGGGDIDDDGSGGEDEQEDALWEAWDAAIGAYEAQCSDDGAMSTGTKSDVPAEVEMDEKAMSRIDSEACISECDEDDSESVNSFFGVGVADDVDSMDALSSLSSSSNSRRSNASVSSLASSACAGMEEQTHVRELVGNPFFCLSDEEEGGNTTGRWIENIPVVRSTSAAAAPIKSFQPAVIWQNAEFQKANARRQRRRKKNNIHKATSSSHGQTTPILSGAVAASVVAAKEMHHPPMHQDLHFRDCYVSFNDLEHILKKYAPWPCLHEGGGVVVDLGCGTSRFCEEMVFHGYRFVYGIDNNPDTIQFQKHHSQAAELVGKYLSFLVMDASIYLDFPDQFCDLIVGKAIFDGISTRCIKDKYPLELVDTLKETIRCLKSGGVLLVVVFNHPDLLDSLDLGEQELVLTSVERVAMRLETPWWKWPEIQRVMRQNLSLVHQCGVGTPRLVDGSGKEVNTPYRVLVWRRKETSGHERMRRLVAMRLEEKRMRRVYETRVWLQRVKQARRIEEEQIIRETRQLILEDEISGKIRSTACEPLALEERRERRLAFYASLLEQERQLMVWEDLEASKRRILEMETKEWIVGMVVELVDTAVDHAISSRLTASGRGGVAVVTQTTASLQLERTGATSAANAWIRHEVLRLVDTALANIGVSNEPPLHKPVQRRRPQRAAADAVESSIPILAISGGAGAPITAQPSPCVETAQAIVQHTLNRILEHILLSLPTVQPDVVAQDVVSTSAAEVPAESSVQEATSVQIGMDVELLQPPSPIRGSGAISAPRQLLQPETSARECISSEATAAIAIKLPPDSVFVPLVMGEFCTGASGDEAFHSGDSIEQICAEALAR